METKRTLSFEMDDQLEFIETNWPQTCQSFVEYLCLVSIIVECQSLLIVNLSISLVLQTFKSHPLAVNQRKKILSSKISGFARDINRTKMLTFLPHIGPNTYHQDYAYC